MITIWNPLIQRLVISLDEPSLRLAVALIDDPSTIMLYVINCAYGDNPKLNLPAFPYPGDFNWFLMLEEVVGREKYEEFNTRNPQYLSNLKLRLGY